jgi:hypothetical protein
MLIHFQGNLSYQAHLALMLVDRQSLGGAKPATTKPVVIWDGSIEWALESLYASSAEKEKQQVFSYSNLTALSSFTHLPVFRHGLRYLPPNDETNVLRTVKIEDLPLHVSMDQVLDKIRGGTIFSAQLLNTVDITNYHTAIVIFINQCDALNFQHYATNTQLCIAGKRARVSIVNTPTYPMPVNIEKLIRQNGYTRCISIRGFENPMMGTLVSLLQNSICRDYLESLEEGDGEREICLRFHSIRIALAAFKLLKDHHQLTQCKIAIAKDPCARPIE